jgi:hypothetical protein
MTILKRLCSKKAIIYDLIFSNTFAFLTRRSKIKKFQFKLQNEK